MPIFGAFFLWRKSIRVCGALFGLLTVVSFGCSQEKNTGIPTPKKPLLTLNLHRGELKLTRTSQTPSAWDHWLRWYRDGKLISGVERETYKIPDKSEAGLYKVSVRFYDSYNASEEVFSEELPVMFPRPDRPELRFDEATFALKSLFPSPSNASSGGWVRSVRWYRDGVLIVHSEGNSHTVITTGKYTAGARFIFGNVASEEVLSAAMVVTIPTPEQPEITFDEDVFTLQSTLTPPPSKWIRKITWYKEGSPISGTGIETYTLPITERYEVGNYKVGVQFSLGEVKSQEVFSDNLTLSVVLGLQNKPMLSFDEETLSIRATISESPPLGWGVSYRWYKNGEWLEEITEPEYFLQQDDDLYKQVRYKVFVQFVREDVASDAVASSEISVSGFREFVRSGDVRSLGISPDGKYIVSGHGSDHTPPNAVKVWSLSDGKLRHTLTGHTDTVKAVAVSNHRVVSGSADRTIKVWNLLLGGAASRTFTAATHKGHTGSVNALAFNGNGNRIVSGSSDHTVKVWDLGKGPLEQTIEDAQRPVLSVAFNAEGNKVVAGGADDTVRVWGHANNEWKALWKKSHPNTIRAVAINRHHVFSGGSQKIKVWEVAHGGLLREISKPPNDVVTSLAASADNQYIISFENPQTIHAWKVSDETLSLPKLSIDFGFFHAVVVRQDGKYIVSGSDESIRVWRVKYLK